MARAAAPGAIGFVFQEPTLIAVGVRARQCLPPLRLAGVARRDAMDRGRGDAGARRGWPTSLARYRANFSRWHVKAGVAGARADHRTGDSVARRAVSGARQRSPLPPQHDLLAAVARDLAKTIVFVTHSVFESVYLSQRVAVMTAAAGAHQRHVTRSPALKPRGEVFRTSPDYAAQCRAVSAALAAASAGGMRGGRAR